MNAQPNRRERFRLRYPAKMAPQVRVRTWDCALAELSPEACRLVTDRLAVGEELTLGLTLQDQAHLLRGTVLRRDEDSVVVTFGRPLHERLFVAEQQRVLRKQRWFREP